MQITTAKKPLLLFAMGITLQAVGGICLMAAALNTARDTGRQVKQKLLQELEKQLQNS